MTKEVTVATELEFKYYNKHSLERGTKPSHIFFDFINIPKNISFLNRIIEAYKDLNFFEFCKERGRQDFSEFDYKEYIFFQRVNKRIKKDFSYYFDICKNEYVIIINKSIRNTFLGKGAAHSLCSNIFT